ncbi:ABC transporter ATP-binding protein [Mesorhizobium sp. CAU 1732]|uniref:ABC transporter ATP-binding protein n=1 Tax=Mesorhizobium sp. CAU 1732 TaxID=3140358 RepID=UPI003260E593
MDDKPILSLRDVRIELKHQRAGEPLVKGVSFDLASKETIAIVGESGSGKSLTSLAIMRLLNPALFQVAGDIVLGGTSLPLLSEKEMRAIRGNRISMVFQEPMTSLNPVMTVGRQIAEVIVEHEGMSYKRALVRSEELLDQVRIPFARQRLNAYPHELSGGMRQRVVIACALACRPELLIADEPTTALDVTVQREVLDLMRSLQAELGMGIIFVTHDMGVVNEVADRTLVMSHGEVVEQGATGTIFTAPQHHYTKKLIAAVPSLKDGFADLEGSASTTEFAVDSLVSRFPIRGGFLNRQTAWNHAVDRASFSVSRGETLGIVGESGSGKSTLARAIMGLSSIDSGSLTLNGVSLIDQRGRRRVNPAIQMVFQDSGAALNPAFTVEQTLDEALKLCIHDTSETPADLLSRVALSEQFLSRFPHELSGGQRQRVCIARALALRPDIIIADESVAALDVTTKFQIIGMLQGLQRDVGISFIFITHDMTVVQRMCHKVVVMCKGKIVEKGSTRDVLLTPAHPYTRKLLSAVLSVDGSAAYHDHSCNQENLFDADSIRPVSAANPELRYKSLGNGHLVLAQEDADGATATAASWR